MTPEEFVKSGQHLPEEIRDWSEQGWLFRWIDEAVNRKKKKTEDSAHYLTKIIPNAVAAQIYTIDFFLWFMGKFGYTLQKVENRPDINFYDFATSMKSFRDEHDRLRFEELSTLFKKEGRHATKN